MISNLKTLALRHPHSSVTKSRLRNELKLLRRLAYQAVFRRGIYAPRTRAEIIDQFHRLYYDSHLVQGTWQDTYWLGVRAAKCPLDLWIYQEMVFDLRPDVIVEAGTAEGGSALYLASLCDFLGHGQVITIDVKERPQRPQHERITYLLGSSTSEEIFARVREMTDGKRVMGFLDSDHSKEHVLRELRAYGPIVSKGSYLVVEDTNVNGHPVDPEFGPGPMEAVDEFLAETDAFVIDETKEKFYLTFNPRGYLRKVA
jgi:cephalosporin hydroxylase